MLNKHQFLYMFFICQNFIDKFINMLTRPIGTYTLEELNHVVSLTIPKFDFVFSNYVEANHVKIQQQMIRIHK